MSINKGYVYMMTDQTHSNLRTGFTDNLVKQFRNRVNPKKFKPRQESPKVKLVYYEVFDEISSAMTRERAIQEWEIRQKINLVNNINPEWEDLTPEIMNLDFAKQNPPEGPPN